MKSIRNRDHNNSHGSNEKKERHSLKKTSTLTGPTPLDFDSFIPWFCLEMQVSKHVIVTRTNQVEYTRYGSKLSRDSSKPKIRSIKMKSSIIKSDHSDVKILDVTKFSNLDISEVVPVTAFYDKRGHLVEIAIVGCPFPINRKLIQAFNICLPFHGDLFKLSIRKGGLNQPVLHEIGKLLPHSNLTDVCLDDSRVPEGNYSELLEHSSHIKYLSLKRCDIKDEQCKRIAQKLDIKGPAAKSLLVLDLTSNKIMDEGARALGEVLKTNRRLLHLNLSGNYISDDGAAYIFRYLKEFQLNWNDIQERKHRRMEYLKSKIIVYADCLKKAKLARILSDAEKASHVGRDATSHTPGVSKKSPDKKPKRTVTSFLVKDMSVEDDAEKMTKEVIGEFEDPFNHEYIRHEGDSVYAIGNLCLFSLNLAYNNLSAFSVKKILEVLEYQSGIDIINKYTGLLRVGIDGNNILYECKELDEIDIYLERAISANQHNVSVISLSSRSSISGKKL